MSHSHGHEGCCSSPKTAHPAVGSLETSQPSILSPICCCGFPTDTPTLTPLCHPSGCHDKAVLLYEYVGKRIVDLQHTEVPDAYRGRGIAKHLAKVRPQPPEGQTCCYPSCG